MSSPSSLCLPPHFGSQVENATGCCDEGTTMVFHMNDGGKFDMKCEDVRIHQQLQFSGSFACGCVKAVGRFELCPTGNSRPGHPETEISYTFTLSGLLGGLFGMMVGKDAIVKGTKDGLANVVAMSERAETQ